MTPQSIRSIRNSLLPLAALTLSGSLALAQAAPPPPATTAPATQPAAPVERQPPSGPGMGPRGMGPGGPGARGMGPGGPMRRGMMQNQNGGHAGFGGSAMMHGRGPGGPGGFHGGPGGGMADGLHIGPTGMWWKNPTVVQNLGLTPDQTKKMDDIFQAARIQLIDLKANVEKQNALLEPMLSANPPDMTKTMAQIDKVAQARADLEKANARMLLGIRVLLTPDQWTKLHSRGPGRGNFAPPQ
jgi:Spy/CpxP family protein refolding chaperone